MSPITHLLASWVVAAQTTDNPRDCRLVTLAGIVPDADGLGLGADLVARAFSTNPTSWYEQYHHFLLHGAFGAVLTSTALAIFANQKWRVALLCLVTFHLHLACDFVGSRGPTPDDLWPIFYFGPFSKEPSGFGRANGVWIAGKTNRFPSCCSCGFSGLRPSRSVRSLEYSALVRTPCSFR